MNLYNINNVIIGYDGNVVAKDISFSVNRGDYLCIVGENGAGKSTLLKAMLGLHKHISGTIVLGEGIKKNTLGYLPQQKDIQRDFPASVIEIVLSGFLNKCGLRPFYSKKEKQLTIDNLKKLGILNLANCCYRELSGGQQQRVLLARALCAANEIILLDEPVAGLDPQATQDMYDIIYKLNQEDKITVVMVSHDISAATKYATHMLFIGKSYVFYGTIAEYQKHLQEGELK